MRAYAATCRETPPQIAAEIEREFSTASCGQLPTLQNTISCLSDSFFDPEVTSLQEGGIELKGIKLTQNISIKEREILVKMVAKYKSSTIYAGEPSAYLTAVEKRVCRSLVKKGFVDNIMDTFYRVNAAGLEQAMSVGEP